MLSTQLTKSIDHSFSLSEEMIITLSIVTFDLNNCKFSFDLSSASSSLDISIVSVQMMLTGNKWYGFSSCQFPSKTNESISLWLGLTYTWLWTNKQSVSNWGFLNSSVCVTMLKA